MVHPKRHAWQRTTRPSTRGQFADSRKREFLYALLTSLNLAAQVRIGHAIELEKAASLLDEAEALIGAESQSCEAQPCKKHCPLISDCGLFCFVSRTT